MKTIFTVMVLAIASVSASASAATCTGTMINRDMVTYVQRGMTVNDISGLLVCAPIEAPGGFAWETRDATMRRQIVVDFAGSVAIQARYQEIPLSPGVGGSSGNNNDTGAQDAAATAIILMALIAKERLALTQAERASVAAKEAACGPMPDPTKECHAGDDNARAACATKMMWHALEVLKCICHALSPYGTYF